MTYFWVMLGSVLGGVARYWLSGLASQNIGETFPVGTLVVNVTGSFVIGFFAAITGPDGRIFVGTDARQFVMTGFCGGDTTFSSFSLQTLSLARDGEAALAGLNVGSRSFSASSRSGRVISRRRAQPAQRNLR